MAVRLGISKYGVRVQGWGSITVQQAIPRQSLSSTFPNQLDAPRSVLEGPLAHAAETSATQPRPPRAWKKVTDAARLYILGRGLRARNPPALQAEVRLGRRILNRMTAIGMPDSAIIE